MMLGKIAVECGAVQLTPGAATGMTVGPEIAKPQPASGVTTGMGTKVQGAINLTRAPVRRGHGVRRHWRRHFGRPRVSFTQGAMRLLRQARKRLRLGGAFALGLSWHGWGGQTRLRPGDMQHDEEP